MKEFYHFNSFCLRNYWFCLVPSFIFAALLAMWFYFNGNQWPAFDEAGHILDAFKYTDLFEHARPWRLSWLHRFFTVNWYYPPTIDVFNGLLKLLLGPDRWVDSLSMIIFNLLLSVTAYFICWLLTESLLASVFTAVFLNLYPQLNNLNHAYILDYPLVSMVSLGLLALIWWHKTPSLKRAVIAGIVLGLTVMSKQIAAAYLIIPAFYYLIIALRKSGNSYDYKYVFHLILMAAIVVLISLPWTLINLHSIIDFAHYNGAYMVKVPFLVALPCNLYGYLQAFPYMMSPVLFLVFVLTLVFYWRSCFNTLLPLLLSGAGGVLLVSCISMTAPLDRYIAPALLAPAMCSGVFFKNLFTGKRWIWKWFAALILAVAVLQFLSFNFAPYPLRCIPDFNSVSERLGVCLREYRGARIYRACPAMPVDWGQVWVIKKIEDKEHGQPVWLNIVPSTGPHSVHTFELVVRSLGSQVRPTTSRRWTLKGDHVEFSPQTALYFQWFLLTSGNQGNQFEDIVSQTNYEKLIKFVRYSGKFAVEAERRLPDGSMMSLYRQKPTS